MGVEPQPKHAIANCGQTISLICCHLANANEDLGGLVTAIPSFAKLLWSVFYIFRFSQDWATQYYYDIRSDEVRIAVEESRREEARRCLHEFVPEVYKIVDPWLSSCQSSCKPKLPDEEKRSQQIQTELYPGHKVHNVRSLQCFLFSGSIINREQGITIAHALGAQDGIEIPFDSDRAAVHRTIIGRCRTTFARLQRQGGGHLTADLALLKLDTDRCSVGNTVWWPYRCSSKALQIKIYKERRIPNDTTVIILDQNGNFQRACIKTINFTDCTVPLFGGGLYDVLGIGAENEEASVTQDGDSGALVMSLPSSETDIVYVYGIVIGIYSFPNGSSFTLANSLWKVIREISTNANYSAALSGGTQDIDFA